MKKTMSIFIFAAAIFCLKCFAIESSTLIEISDRSIEFLDLKKADLKSASYQERLSEIDITVSLPKFIGITGDSIRKTLLDGGLDFDLEWAKIVENYNSPGKLQEIFKRGDLPEQFLSDLHSLKAKISHMLKRYRDNFRGKASLCLISLDWFSFCENRAIPIDVDEFINEARTKQLKISVQNEKSYQAIVNPNKKELIDAISLAIDSCLSEKVFLDGVYSKNVETFYNPDLNISISASIDDKDDSECLVYLERKNFNPQKSIASTRCDHFIKIISVDDNNIQNYYIDNNNFIHYIAKDIADIDNPSSLAPKVIQAADILLEMFDQVFKFPQYIKLIYNKKNNEIHIISRDRKIEHVEDKLKYGKNYFYKKRSLVNGLPAFDIISLIEKDPIAVSKIVESYFIRGSDENFLEGENKVRKALAMKWVRNSSKRIFDDNLRFSLELFVNAYDASIGFKEDVGKFGMGFFSVLSLLSHEETDGTVITVDSCYRMGNGGVYAYRTSFENDINGLPEIRFAKLDASEFGNKTGAKISIIPKNSQKFFSKQTLKGIKNYAHYLDFYDEAQLKLQFKESPEAKVVEELIGNQNPYHLPRVECKLLPNLIFVGDEGCGISLEDLFLKLLVPSSTTKETKEIVKIEAKLLRAGVSQAKLVEFKGKKDPSKSHFLIVINGVVVCNEPMQKGAYDFDGNPLDILISMPQITKLTLARNAIDISSKGNSFEEEYLKKVISSTLNQKLLSNNSREDRLLFEGLYHGLSEFESRSSISHISGTFTSHFIRELEAILESNMSLIPTPKEGYYRISSILELAIPAGNGLKPPTKSVEVCSPLQAQGERQLPRCAAVGSESSAGIALESDPSITLLPIDGDLIHHNYNRLEKHLVDFFAKKLEDEKDSIYKKIALLGVNGKLIGGKNVFFVETNKLPARICSLGLRSSLFVSKNLIEKASTNLNGDLEVEEIVNRLVMNIVNTYTEQDLIHYQNIKPEDSLVVSVSNISKDKKETPWFYEDLHDIYDTTKSCSIFTEMENDIVKRVFEQNPFFEKSYFYFCLYKEHINNLGAFDELLCKYLVKIAYQNERFVNNNNFTENLKNEDVRFFDTNLLLDFLLYNKALDEYLLISGFSKKKNSSELFAHLLKKVPNIETDMDFLIKFYLANAEELDQGEFDQGEFDQEGLKRKIFAEDRLKNLIAGIRDFSLEIAIRLKPYELMNNLVGKLLYTIGIISENGEIDKEKYIFVDEKQIWPIKGKLTEEKLIKLLTVLKNYDHWEKFDLRNLQTDENTRENSIVILFPKLSGKEFAFAIKHKHTQKSFKDGVAWAVSHEKTLKYAIENIEISSIFKDIFAFCDISHENHRKLDPEAAKSLYKLKENALGLYNKYLNVPDSAIKRLYTKGAQKPQLIKSENDASPKEAYLLLSEIHEDKSIFNQLINFQIFDFKFQTDIELRNRDLSGQNNNVGGRIFYIPTIFANTPISILANLRKGGVDIEVIKTIIKEARTPEELMFTSHVLSSENSKKICNFKEVDELKRKEIIIAIELMIKYFLRERIDKEVILDWYDKNRVSSSLKERLNRFENEPAKHIMEDYLEEVSQSTTIFKKRKDFLSKAISSKANKEEKKSFTLKQLLKAHVVSKNGLEDLLRTGDLQAIRKIVKSYDSNIDIAKITHDIEVGSEKNPIEASIIETMQNSIDAANGFLRQMKERHSDVNPSWNARMKQFSENSEKIKKDIATIRYKIESMDDIEDLKSICLTARDHVGFPSLEILLTDFILPDYSNKSSSFANIGDMGNGSFNMYKHAEKVSVLTRLTKEPEKVYLLLITPIRNNKTSLVDDLDLLCLDVSNEVKSDFFGTSIRILFQSQDKGKTDMNLLYAKNVLASMASTLQFDLPLNEQIYLYLDEERLNSPLNNEDIIYEIKDNNTGKYIYRLRKRRNKFAQSYLTTSGLPFQLLHKVAKNSMILPSNFISLFDSGFILDISLDTYEPVQSRTRLQLKPKYLKSLKQFLLDAYYIIGLNRGKENSDFFVNSFMHFGAGGPFDQLMLSYDKNRIFQDRVDSFLNKHEKQISLDLVGFFTYYKNSSWHKRNFCEIINDSIVKIIEKMGPETQKMELKIKEELHLLKEKLKTIADDRQKELLISNYENLIERCQKEMEAIKTDLRNELKTILLEEEVEKYGFVEEVVLPWLDQKEWSRLIIPFFNTLDDETLQTCDQKDRIKELEISWNEKGFDFVAKEGTKLLEKMINEYSFDLLKSIGTAKRNLNHAYFTYEPSESYKAMYEYNLHSGNIFLNLAGFDLRDFIEALAELIEDSDEPISQREKIVKLFVPKRGHTPTIVHELEHVRRKEGSEKISAHDRCEIEKGEKEFKKVHEFDFDVCANHYGKYAIEDELLKKWHYEILKIVGDLDINKNYFAEQLLEINKWIEDNVNTEGELAYKFALKKMNLLKTQFSVLD